MERATRVVERLKGPVVPLNLCFRADGSVDFAAVGRYVDWLCGQQVPVLLLTYGSSEFASLTDEDIWRLTAEVGKACAGRSLFIASTGLWPPRQCRAFLQHADQAGADAVKVQIHPFHPRTREFTAGYYDLLEGASDIPLLVWGIGPDPLPVEVVAELARRENVVGIKNDADQFYGYYDLIRATRGQTFAVVSGGQMRNFAFGYQVGSPAYLCTIAPFRPDIALDFYHLLVDHRYEEAWETVRRYEDPWLGAALEVGWLKAIKTALYLRGLYPDNQSCPPMPPPTPQQVEKVRRALETVFGPIARMGL
jgi:4-hydroxy-tetrahydrodipicolinate synthase